MTTSIIVEYGKMLKKHALDLCKKADGETNKEKAKELRTLASAVEWAVELALPRHVLVDFNVLYRAAQENIELRNILAEIYGSEDNVEIAAKMRGLLD